MKTTDEIIALTREQQHEFYASLTDAERRALWRQLVQDTHAFVYDRMASDHLILTTGAAVGHPRHGLYLELVEDFEKVRAHRAEIERRIAEGAHEYKAAK